MLLMSAFQFRYPVEMLILVVANDFAQPTFPIRVHAKVLGELEAFEFDLGGWKMGEVVMGLLS